MGGARGRAIRAVMERRLLVSYRIEPRVLQAVLPAPFRPALADGYGVGSICLIRLAGIRPGGWLPAWPRAEDAAHRIAPAGYSATPVPGVFDGVTLETSYRERRPLRVDSVTSSYFDDPRLFPPGTATVDSAFVVTGLATWRPLAPLVASPGEAVLRAGQP